MLFTPFQITQKARERLFPGAQSQRHPYLVSKTVKHGYQKQRSQCIEVQKDKKNNTIQCEICSMGGKKRYPRDEQK